LQAGYSNETATVTKNNITVTGGASSTGIVIQIGTTAPAIATFTLAGTAPINILDSPQGNGLVGNAGNNVITVTDGSDAVDGGLGIDRLIVDYHLATGAVTGNSTSNFTEAGGSRLVSITDGTFENFTVLTGSGADTLTVGNGDNIIRAGSGANTITAGNGVNSITGGSGADTITAGDGGNSIDAGNGTNTITSGGGNDVIISGSGADTIVAGGGNDVITLRGGSDHVNSGAGVDRLIVDYSASTTAVIGGVTGGNLGSGYTGHIADSAGNLVDFVSTETFAITTGSGNDVVTSGAGNDTLNGGSGNDILRPGAGTDTVNGGGGNDYINLGASLTSVDKIDGGAGTDTVQLNGDYTGANAVTFNATTMVNVEALTLSAGHSYTLTTNNATVAAGKTLTIAGFRLTASNALTFNGAAETNGSLWITSGAGNDTLNGGSGNDILRPGAGTDTVTGGNGNDYINMGASLTSVDKIDGGAGVDSVQLSGDYTGAKAVVMSATTLVNVEMLDVSVGHSYNLTTNNATVASGQTLTINGSALGASDVLTFNGAAETDGKFVIIGGAGADNLTGGALSDTFVYSSATQSTGTHYDTITGFNFAADSFDIPGGAGTITAIDAKVTSGSLSTTSFDTNLTSAMSGHLGAHHAVLFTPTAGTLSGATFMVVDLNGVAGYQTGHDLVIRMVSSSGTLAAGGFH
jgi:Ca2+-binding RTX toxin-like protein